jgi:hypothetical protein
LEAVLQAGVGLKQQSISAAVTRDDWLLRRGNKDH